MKGWPRRKIDSYIRWVSFKGMLYWFIITYSQWYVWVYTNKEYWYSTLNKLFPHIANNYFILPVHAEIVKDCQLLQVWEMYFNQVICILWNLQYFQYSFLSVFEHAAILTVKIVFIKLKSTSLIVYNALFVTLNCRSL